MKKVNLLAVCAAATICLGSSNIAFAQTIPVTVDVTVTGTSQSQSGMTVTYPRQVTITPCTGGPGTPTGCGTQRVTGSAPLPSSISGDYCGALPVHSVAFITQCSSFLVKQ